jgi:hypothetical protein
MRMMPRLTKLQARAETVCDRLNDGLASVAFVLAIAVFMAGTCRIIELFEITAQDGASMADVLPLQPFPD